VAKRTGNPQLSAGGQEAVAEYAQYLHREQDLRADTRRNYLSDLRQFAAWCGGAWGDGRGDAARFAPSAVTTPTITAYRAHLQAVVRLAPATSNRHLVRLKRYCGWACDRGLVALDPARPVKLVPRVPTPPRHLSDKEEAALLAAVTAHGTPRDRTLLVTALHTGLRAEELCNLQRADLTIVARSGRVTVYGKRNKYREVPLNSTARAALSAWLATLPPDAAYLFPSKKGGGALTARALGYLLTKYATLARVVDVSPHDLRHRFGYRMARTVPLHRLAQIMGHDALDTTRLYVGGTRQDLQQAVEEIAWA